MSCPLDLNHQTSILSHPIFSTCYYILAGRPTSTLHSWQSIPADLLPRLLVIFRDQVSTLMIVTSLDVVYALKRQGRTLYGFGAQSTIVSSHILGRVVLCCIGDMLQPADLQRFVGVECIPVQPCYPTSSCSQTSLVQTDHHQQLYGLTMPIYACSSLCHTWSETSKHSQLVNLRSRQSGRYKDRDSRCRLLYAGRTMSNGSTWVGKSAL